MAIKSISTILKSVAEKTTLPFRKEVLWEHRGNTGLLTILKLAYDPGIVFNLPEGAPPYKPCPYLDQENMLYTQLRKIHYFLGESKLPPMKREKLFIDMLEALDPEDAKLMIAVKDKSIPYPGITRKLVEQTFPGLLPPEAEVPSYKPAPKKPGRKVGYKVKKSEETEVDNEQDTTEE
jgi:hypothetical protein